MLIIIVYDKDSEKSSPCVNMTVLISYTRLCILLVDFKKLKNSLYPRWLLYADEYVKQKTKLVRSHSPGGCNYSWYKLVSWCVFHKENALAFIRYRLYYREPCHWAEQRLAE